MSSSGGVWSSVPTNSNVVVLESDCGIRSIVTVGAMLSMPSTMPHSYSAASSS